MAKCSVCNTSGGNTLKCEKCNNVWCRNHTRCPPVFG